MNRDTRSDISPLIFPLHPMNYRYVMKILGSFLSAMYCPRTIYWSEIQFDSFFVNMLHTNLWCKVVVIKCGMNVLMSYYWQRSTVLERISHKSNRRTQSASCNGSTDSVVCTEKRVKHFLVFWKMFHRSYSNLIRLQRCWWRIWRRNTLVTTLRF